MYMIYHIKSTMQVGPLPNSGRPHSLFAKVYKTAHHAARTCAKFNAGKRFANYADERDGREQHGPGEYGWCSVQHYQEHVVRMVTRTNMMSGKQYQEASNTPGYCSPSSESYWSM